jgi:hypothetical protein
MSLAVSRGQFAPNSPMAVAPAAPMSTRRLMSVIFDSLPT